MNLSLNSKDKEKIRVDHGQMISHVVLVTADTLFVLYAGAMAYNFKYVKDERLVAGEADITGRLQEFLSHEENFYLLSDFYVTNNPMSITRGKYAGIYANSAYIGNWIYPSPISMYYAGEYGIENSIRALVLKDNVYLHATDENMAELVRFYLSKVLDAEVTYQVEGDGVYKYYPNTES